MATVRWVESFEAARICGFHNFEERPRKGEPQVHIRDMRRFNKAMAAGNVPRPHKKRGTSTNLWNYARLVKEYDSGIWEGHGDDPPEAQKKKADDCANSHQPKTATHKPIKESEGKRNLPHRTRDVNGENGAVRHAE